MKVKLLGLAGIAIAVSVIPVLAHHSFAMFDQEHPIQKTELLSVDDDISNARLSAEIFGGKNGPPARAETEQDDGAHSGQDRGQDHGSVEMGSRGAEDPGVVDVNLRNVAHRIDDAGEDDHAHAV